MPGNSIGSGNGIIVVDDDSADGTGKIVDRMAQGDSSLRLIRRSGRRGLTTALQEGIDRANGSLIGWLDCDLSMPPETLSLLIRTATTNADIAMGSRYIPGGADLRSERLAVILSKIICTLCHFLLHKSVTDYTSGFIVAQRKVLKQIRLRGFHGEYFIDLINQAMNSGFTVREIPYQLVSRKKGISKTAPHPFGFVFHGRKYLATMIQTWWRSRCS